MKQTVKEESFTRSDHLNLSPDHYLEIGSFYFNNKKPAESEQWLKRVLETGDDSHWYQSARACFFLGMIYQSKDREKMAFYFKKGIRLLKEKAGTYEEKYLLASLYKNNHQLKEAQKWFREIAAGYPFYVLLAGAYFHLGEIYLAEKEQGLARDMLQKCVSLLPGHQKAREYLEKLVNHGVS